MSFLRKHWRFTAPAVIVICALLIGAVMMHSSNGKPTETKTVYVMPERHQQDLEADSSVSNTQSIVKEANQVIEHSITDATSKTNEEAKDRKIAELKAEIAATKLANAEKDRKIEENNILLSKLRKQKEEDQEWSDLHRWLIDNRIREQLAELEPDLWFIHDAEFKGDNVLEYFPEGEDRIFYVEKLLRYIEIVEQIADKLAAASPDVREEVLDSIKGQGAGDVFFTQLVEDKIGGGL